MNNSINIIGKITKDVEVAYMYNKEVFYKTEISVKRLGNVFDVLPLTIPESLIFEDMSGKTVRIYGSIRTQNKKEENHNKLFLYVFVEEIELISGYDDYNRVELNGFICKTPIYRTTPGGREISDTIIAVNRPYGKSDYIPCIFWGRNAKSVKELSVGDEISLSGRLQSRTYIKNNHQYITYEVSTGSYVLLSIKRTKGCS